MARLKKPDPPAALFEYAIDFVFVPDLSKMKPALRAGAVKRFVRKVEKDGWKVTQESIDRSQSPTEHLRETRMYGVEGWMTRVELQRVKVRR
jgi:hypothetical protein